MSKLDEIKDKAKNKNYEYDDDFGGYTDHQEDIQYLLSRLEIAEKALEDVVFETDVPVSDVIAIKRISHEALQQLRE